MRTREPTVGRRRAGLAPGVAVVLGVVVAAACGGSLPLAPVVSPADARREALLTERDTRLTRPSQLTFAWSAREPDFRGSGVGVARVEPPYKARLDLFLDNGETVAVAALVDDELRIPDALPTELVPPPALLWAAFGVFRPGDGAQLVEGRIASGTGEMLYRLPAGDRMRFRLRDHSVLEVSLLERESVVERIVVSDTGEGAVYPEDATYRNLRDFRELRLQLESFEYVDSFPPDIWEPNGE